MDKIKHRQPTFTVICLDDILHSLRTALHKASLDQREGVSGGVGLVAYLQMLFQLLKVLPLADSRKCWHSLTGCPKSLAQPCQVLKFPCFTSLVIIMEILVNTDNAHLLQHIAAL